MKEEWMAVCNMARLHRELNPDGSATVELNRISLNSHLIESGLP